MENQDTVTGQRDKVYTLSRIEDFHAAVHRLVGDDIAKFNNILLAAGLPQADEGN